MVSINKIKNKFFWLPAILTIIDALLKLFRISLWVDINTMGLYDKIVWIGVIELCCLVVFLIPRTMVFGFFLLCCHLGGEFVAFLKIQEFNLSPVLILALFAFAAYWRDSSTLHNSHSDDLKQ